MAAADVAQFLWNKFSDSLQEAEAESELSALISDFQNIKQDMMNRDTLERICSSHYNRTEILLDFLYDLNELLGECRVLANRVKQLDQSLSRLISLKIFLYRIRRKVKPELTRISNGFKQLVVEAVEAKGRIRRLIQHTILSESAMVERAKERTIFSEVDVSKIIEFDAHVEKIESLLLGNRSDDVGFTAIGIVGMFGVGKTTLVQKIFNSPTVQKEFSKKVWICLSDLLKEGEVDIRVKIVKYIFKELGHDLTDEVTTDLVELLKKLKSFLSNGNGNGRYLIVLDDVWHTHEFVNFNYNLGEKREECLWYWLPKAKDKDCNGAVIVTSRKSNVAEFIVGDNNFLLHLHPSFTKESCWKIFQNTNSCNLVNHRKIMESCWIISSDHRKSPLAEHKLLELNCMELCHGLPLAAKALGNSPLYWMDIARYGETNVTYNTMEKLLKSHNMAKLQKSYDNLENIQLKFCLLILLIFLEKYVIKKRPLIYWWIGEGLIKAKGAKTAEEVGEEIFVKLIAESLIIAKFDNEWSWSPVVNRCAVHPWIRYMLIPLVKEAQFFVFDSTGTPSCNTLCRRACLGGEYYSKSDHEVAKLLTVFNVNEGYPSFSDVDWLKKLKNVVTLQLGRWQDSVKHHIETEDNILKDLGAQKHLKYLSLQGISRITELPDSVVNLISLEILDLRACHNLERLPDKIESLRKLTHLDVPECYLLESMPKGLEKLPALQVLKGFVVGDPINKTPCIIGYLSKLRKLSIRIGKTAVIRTEQFEKLRDIESLCCLTISWGKGLEDKEFPSLSFPSNLEKLDLRDIPLEEATDQWLQPSKLTKLKKLYIRGGELNGLDSENGETGGWKVEILYLKYLKILNITFSELQNSFPHLRYLEKIECHENDEDIVWDKSKGRLWPKEEKQRHAARESVASSSKS